MSDCNFSTFLVFKNKYILGCAELDLVACLFDVKLLDPSVDFRG